MSFMEDLKKAEKQCKKEIELVTAVNCITSTDERLAGAIINEIRELTDEVIELKEIVTQGVEIMKSTSHSETPDHEGPVVKKPNRLYIVRKVVCDECDWVGKPSEVLHAVNPFNADCDIMGCPHCKSVDTILTACDEPYCTAPVSCETPTPDGCRRTCEVHKPKEIPDFNSGDDVECWHNMPPAD